MHVRKKTTALRALGTVVAALGLVAGFQAPSAVAADGGLTWKNANSQRYLEVGGWAENDGALVNQWDYHGGNNQLWTPSGKWINGQWWGTERNVNSGKCLEVADWGKQNGAIVRQWECTGGDNQLWNTHLVDDNIVYLINKHSGKCLEISGWSTVNGARAQQWDCHGGANQMWVM